MALPLFAALYAVIIGIAVWARLSLARKPGRGAASRKGKGNVEQSHIRSSRTGTSSEIVDAGR